MEKNLIELGLETYKVAGVMGLLVLIIAILVTLSFRAYARQVRRQSIEIERARKEVRQIQREMQRNLQEMLDECEQSCMVKDSIIDEQRKAIETYRRNEIFLQNEIQALQVRVRNLEEEVQ